MNQVMVMRVWVRQPGESDKDVNLKFLCVERGGKRNDGRERFMWWSLYARMLLPFQESTYNKISIVFCLSRLKVCKIPQAQPLPRCLTNLWLNLCQIENVVLLESIASSLYATLIKSDRSGKKDTDLKAKRRRTAIILEIPTYQRQVGNNILYTHTNRHFSLLLVKISCLCWKFFLVFDYTWTKKKFSP